MVRSNSWRPSTFLPIAAVTGIGSLPFISPVEAIEAVAACSPEIPFWPQLPARSRHEDIVGQALGVLSGFLEPRNEGYGYRVADGAIDKVVAALHGSSGELTLRNAAGFSAFNHALSTGLYPSAVAVKGQIEGPITLSAYLFHKGRPFLSDPALFAALAFHISQIVRWQIERLQSAELPVLLFIDEPALCLEVSSGALDALAAILETARLRGAYAGLHCCAANPFSRMCRVRPDILSFDAHQGLELFFSHPDALAFAKSGGIVAYGLIPTLRDLAAVRAEQIFTRWLTLASLAGDPEDFARNAMITATCGLGLLNPATVAQSFATARTVSHLIAAVSKRGQTLFPAQVELPHLGVAAHAALTQTNSNDFE